MKRDHRFAHRRTDQGAHQKAHWIASGGKWTVPVGGGFGKVVRLGGQPVQLELDAYDSAIRPQAANDPWLIQLTMTFIFAEAPR
jgi:hypothetical protein